MSGHNKTLLQKANAAIAKGDIDGFLAHCTDDTEWTFVGQQTLLGKEAVRQYMKEAYIHPPRFDVAEMIAENDLVTAMGNLTLTGPDGKETHYAYCDVWRFRGDLIAELRAYVVQIKQRRAGG
jgi:uncharacterized protein